MFVENLDHLMLAVPYTLQHPVSKLTEPCLKIISHS